MTNAIKKLANGTMKDIKKVQGMKTVFEAKLQNVPVFFRKNGDTLEIIAPCLKTDQTDNVKLLKKYFK